MLRNVGGCGHGNPERHRQTRFTRVSFDGGTPADTVQLTVDLATLIRDKVQPDELARARRRARIIVPAVAGFTAGCMAGAILELYCRLWALILPASTAGLALLVGVLWRTQSAGDRSWPRPLN